MNDVKAHATTSWAAYMTSPDLTDLKIIANRQERKGHRYFIS